MLMARVFYVIEIAICLPVTLNLFQGLEDNWSSYYWKALSDTDFPSGTSSRWPKIKL